MATRSTTSSNQPPPPFYALHQVGVHRNTHRASNVTGYSPAICAVTTNVVSGRKIDSVYSTATVNPQITDSVTQTIAPLNLQPPAC
jgi:hypothetical protein